jgi:hypothetical protein
VPPKLAELRLRRRTSLRHRAGRSRLPFGQREAFWPGPQGAPIHPATPREENLVFQARLPSHEEFVAKHGLNVPLLADVDKKVAKAYSAYSSRLGTKRAVIVIDEQGVVRHRHDHLLGLDFQSVDDLRAALDELD